MDAISPPRFLDRADAGRRLAASLQRLAVQRPVILGLPRCGVPVACEVALALDAPLDVVLVRRLRAPHDPDATLGIVLDGAPPDVFLHPGGAGMRELREAWLDVETASAVREIESRRQLYRGGAPCLSIAGRVADIVDQAIRRGETMRAAALLVARADPDRVVLAAPVGAHAEVAGLRDVAHEIVCLDQPDEVGPLGRHYVDARQITHDEVVACLERSRATRRDSEKRRNAAEYPRPNSTTEETP